MNPLNQLVVTELLQQRSKLNEKLLYICTYGTQWSGYAASHRDIKSELVRIDDLLTKFTYEPTRHQSEQDRG